MGIGTSTVCWMRDHSICLYDQVKNHELYKLVIECLTIMADIEKQASSMNTEI